MKTPIKAYVGAKIHDGIELHINHALVIYDGGDCNVVSMDDVPKGCVSEAFSSGIIFPGFVDLQVNGGGGVMFNDEQSVDALRTIAAAHAAKDTLNSAQTARTWIVFHFVNQIHAFNALIPLKGANHDQIALLRRKRKRL